MPPDQVPPGDAGPSSPAPEKVTAELVDGEAPRPDEAGGDGGGESIDHPAKVMRLGSMVKQLLEELRGEGLDEPSRAHLRRIHQTVVDELGGALSPELSEELGRLAVDLSPDSTPTPDELRVAQAQLVGWLEGLVQGMQAMLFAQQVAAQQELASMRGQLPGTSSRTDTDVRPGTYL